MAIESLLALGFATLVLLVVSIYANKNRSENPRKKINRHHVEKQNMRDEIG